MLTARRPRQQDSAGRAQRNLIQRLPALRRRSQLRQVFGQPGRALVAFVGFLGQQAQDDLRQRGRKPRRQLSGRKRFLGEVRMDQGRPLAIGKRRTSRGQPVKRAAERIKISAVIDRTIHASGLLRSEISGIGWQPVQRHKTSVTRLEGHRVPESGEQNFFVAPAEIFRPQIPVRHAALVHAGHGAGHLFCESEKSDQVPRHVVAQGRRIAVPIDARDPIEKRRDTRAVLDMCQGTHGEWYLTAESQGTPMFLPAGDIDKRKRAPERAGARGRWPQATAGEMSGSEGVNVTKAAAVRWGMFSAGDSRRGGQRDRTLFCSRSDLCWNPPGEPLPLQGVAVVKTMQRVRKLSCAGGGAIQRRPRHRQR